MELPIVRPSLLDRRFTADAYIVKHDDGELSLRLGEYNLARIAGLSLDLPSLNQIVDRIWHRRIRRSRRSCPINVVKSE